MTTEDQAVIERRERLRKRAASLQPEYPACFDGADQYREWRAETRHSSPGANGYCADCSPKDQALMIREGYRNLYLDVSHRPRGVGRSKYTNWSRLKASVSDLLGVIWLKSRARRPGQVVEF